MRRIRVGIIGQGRSGRDIHGAWLIRDQGRYEIRAVVDPMKDRRERAVREYGCEAYRDHGALLKRDDLDLVINATQSHMHVPVSLEILRAGFNCLTEKPLANRAGDVDRLIAGAKKAKKVLAVFQQSRFAPYFVQVRKVIESGVLGRIVQINVSFNGFSRRYDWQTLQGYMGGNLLNTGPHPMDQALQLFGTDVMPEVFCHMDCANTAGDAEDHVFVSLRGEGRPLVNVEISSCFAHPTPIYRVYGTCGSMEANMTEANWRYFDPKSEPKAPRLQKKPLCGPDGTPCYPINEIRWKKRSWKLPKSQGDLFSVISQRFYRMLHDTLVKGVPLEVTVEQVRQQIAVVEECQRQNPQIYGGRGKSSRASVASC